MSLLVVASCQAGVTINNATSILIDTREPEPVRKAAHDLAKDMEAVFGAPVRVVHSTSEASATTLAIAFSHNLPAAVKRPEGWEVLRIQAVREPWSGSPVREAVVLTGSDVRGTIYAIYQFSRKFLGVDPFYWWTDNMPERRKRVIVSDAFAEQQGSPTFRYRGWFLNDEDLMTAWRPGTADKTGISLEVWDRIYEALLRLKANMVIPGTFVFPDEPQMYSAVARGLILSQHHIEPLGLNVYRWPENQPYTLGLMLDAWRCSTRQFPKGAEIVWTVGLRGRYDNPYWTDTPDAPRTPEAKAQLIRTAIGKQMEIVRRERPETHPDFIMNTWMEGSNLVRGGGLQIPEGVHRVWADDGAGTIQDGGLMAKGDGVYYHTAVVGGNANNFTERVPLRRIERELGRAARAGATHYLLLNPSNILPVSLTTRAVMEIGWNATPWMTEEGEHSSAYLAEWCREQFGPDAGPLVARVYQGYFEAPARYATREQFEMGDNFYQQVARDLLLRMIRGQTTTDRVIEPDTSTPEQHRKLAGTYEEYLAGLGKSCAAARKRWRKTAEWAAEARPLIPVARRDFFQAHVLSQIAVHRCSNRMLQYVAEAALPTTTAPARLERVSGVITELRHTLQALRDAGYGKWEGFYTRGDWFVNVPLTLELAQVCLRHLEGRELSAEDREVIRTATHYVTANTADVFIRIKAYQGDRRVRFCKP